MTETPVVFGLRCQEVPYFGPTERYGRNLKTMKENTAAPFLKNGVYAKLHLTISGFIWLLRYSFPTILTSKTVNTLYEFELIK